MTFAYDPEIAAVIAHLPALDVSDIPAARRSLIAIRESVAPVEVPDELDLTRTSVPDDAGRRIGLQVLAPRTRKRPTPALLWFHGGGFVMGDPETDLRSNLAVAAQLGAVVVSVDYSLAPEHPYPVALEQGYAVLRWLAAHPDVLGIDAGRLAVGGSSAGACLAAGVALLARDRRGPAIAFQTLDVPVTDDRLDTPSMQLEGTLMWSRASAAVSWRAYLGAEPGTARGYAAPLRVADLTGLPPAYVAVCEFDPLRDEGIAYAQRLVASGVSTELHLYPGTFHGSAGAVAGSSVSRRMNADLVAALGRGLS